MLEQFLISNQTLKLDETFKVYLKVLSIDHMNFRNTSARRTHTKRTTAFYKKHYGARVRPQKRFNYFWALDVPDFSNEPMKSILKNKCFISATILGLLQNAFYKSERNDTRFLHLQRLNSTCLKKKNYAGNLLVKEINDLLSTTNLPKNGPYELEKTAEILHNSFNCQFFIFDGLDNSNKLKFIYPPIYDDSLIPIYLYEPHENPNHVVFIQNLNSYFKANLKICFACKKTFVTQNYKHFCKEKKSCFSCRRFFSSSTTYVHEKLSKLFCDKDITNEKSFLCSICNVTCYSNHCFLGHKLLCAGQGTFGFKCLKCQKFTYRYGNLNGTDLKSQHKCGERKNCSSCRKEKEDDHLCLLMKEVSLNQNNTNIAFIGMEHFDLLSENCFNCFNLRQSNSENLYCDLHKNDKSIDKEDNFDPCLIVTYLCHSTSLTKYIFSCFNDPPFIEQEEFLPHEFHFNFGEALTKPKVRKSEDFKRNLKKLQEKPTFLIIDMFLKMITDVKWNNTTFICQDADSQILMTILRAFVRNGFCPIIVRNGRNILVLEIKGLKIRFITSNAYFEGNEYQLAQQYDLKFIWHFFPRKFLQPHNLNYVGQVPEINFFNSLTDNLKEKEMKTTFVHTLTKLNYKWDLQKEIVTYCEQKLTLLTLACLKFLNDCLIFQLNLNSKLNTTFEFLNPFGYYLCSLGGYVFKLFKIYYLNKEEIYAVNNEFGISCKNVSKIEYEWASFMDFLNPEKQFVFAFNNKEGQKYFKEAIPDLYSPVTKQAYFFNGCVYHGHYENCLLNPNATPLSKNPFGKTYEDLNKEFFEKMTKLLLNNEDEINEIVIRWECHYKKLRESNLI